MSRTRICVETFDSPVRVVVEQPDVALNEKDVVAFSGYDFEVPGDAVVRVGTIGSEWLRPGSSPRRPEFEATDTERKAERTRIDSKLKHERDRVGDTGVDRSGDVDPGRTSLTGAFRSGNTERHEGTDAKASASYKHDASSSTPAGDKAADKTTAPKK